MNTANTDEYRSLDSSLSHSEEGLYLLIASEAEQRKVVEYYQRAGAVVYDCKRTDSSFSFRGLEQWVSSEPHAKTFFIINFQILTQEKQNVEKLNFSRDMLARLQKNIVFCLTQRADDLLARSAYDFYSYVKLRFFFQDEFKETINDRDVPSLYVVDKSIGVNDEVDFQKPKSELLTLAISLVNQAKQMRSNYRYQDALRCLQNALEIRKRFLDEQDINIAIIYEKIAHIYNDICEYLKALELFKKALAIKKSIYPGENSDIAASYNDIGVLYQSLGSDEKAKYWLEKALTIDEKIFGSDHLRMAIIYENLAVMHVNMKNYSKALEYIEKSLAIEEKCLGENHPEIATTYMNFTLVYNHLGEYQRALQYCEKALKIKGNAFGYEHTDIADIYTNIALTYGYQGEYEKAMEYSQKALDILEKLLGKANPNTARVYANIAILYSEQNQFEKALEFCNKAYSMFVNSLGKNHPDTKKIVENIEEIKGKVERANTLS